MGARKEDGCVSALSSASLLCSCCGFLVDMLTRCGKGSCRQKQMEEDLALFYPCYSLGWLLEVPLELTLMKCVVIY